MNLFEPLDFPLSGKRLIEASAGTGKTYNIANIYLLLILGLGKDAERGPLTVDQVLVVTFTRAAANELRGRIRTLLEKTYRDFRKGDSREAFIRDLIALAGDERQTMIRRLRDAILNMDEASISTIHSFAVKVAQSFVFETGTLSDTEISQNSGEKTDQVLSDIYRQLLKLQDTGIEPYLQAAGLDNRNDFFNYFRGVTQHQDFSPAFNVEHWQESLESMVSDLAGFENQLKAPVLAERARLKAFWNEKLDSSGEDEITDELGALLNILLAKETKPNPAPGPAMYTSIEKVLACETIKPPRFFASRNKTSQRWDALLATNPGPENEWFAFVRAVMRHADSGPDDKALKASCIRAAVAQLQSNRLEKEVLTRLHLDEVVDLINKRLDDEPGAQLRSIIKDQYPVCLVDEFQDTDPEQFRMFNRIYDDSGSPGDNGFFMIGDPKQSIFGFRAADIFAYLNVRKKVRDRERADPADKRIFNLDTNWRSKKSLVEALNALFRESPEVEDPDRDEPGKRTFVFPGIAYHEVNSCETDERCVSKDYSLGAGSQLPDRPLVFVGNGGDPESTDTPSGFSDLMKVFARDTAHRISAILSGDTGAKRAGGNGIDHPILPGDIAVLVRNKYEAHAVREALADGEIGLRCVYVSQKDSVFSDSEIAEDIYHILVAINENRDKRRLKSALATPLMRGFSVRFDEIDRLENDDAALENRIEEFGRCREAWTEKGILTALNRLFANAERNLYQKISTRDDSDRILTDLRHLGDLLQQQGLHSDSPEQLIDWYASQLDDDSALDEDSKRIRLESDENLVRIVTIFVAKGLEYPLVFLPFFFMPKPIDMNKRLPLYRKEVGGEYKALVDFSSERETVQKAIEREVLAEEMRLLYVAVTRAVYQCFIGISQSTYYKKPVFQKTVWAHLLGLEEDSPDWNEIRIALEDRLKPVSDKVAYCVAGDVDPVRYEAPRGSEVEISKTAPSISAPASNWRITSYSALAKGESPALDRKDDDDEGPGDASADDTLLVDAGREEWQFNARYWLQGSAKTGTCLHEILEQQVLEPAKDLDAFVETAFEHLAFYGLDKPYRQRQWSEQKYREHCENYERSFKNWMRQFLNQRLEVTGRCDCPSLLDVFETGQVIPEMAFDFAIGMTGESRFSEINSALNESGVTDIQGSGEIEGLMNGSIDLVFIHDKKIYIADYKSNTLGKTPEFYDDAGMAACMTDKRYDLQYMIYSVAAHRYFKQRLAGRYRFDGGEYSFGGVFYLFLRGMGLDAPYQEHGIWFRRPEQSQVSALDRAFLGDDAATEQGDGP